MSTRIWPYNAHKISHAMQGEQVQQTHRIPWCIFQTTIPSLLYTLLHLTQFLWTKSGLRCLRVVFSLNPTQSILIPVLMWIKYQNRPWGNCTLKSKLPYNCFPTDSHRTTTIRLQCFLLLRWQPEVIVHTTHWCWLRWITAVSKNRNALGLRRSKGGCLSTKPRQR